MQLTATLKFHSHCPEYVEKSFVTDYDVHEGSPSSDEMSVKKRGMEEWGASLCSWPHSVIKGKSKSESNSRMGHGKFRCP